MKFRLLKENYYLPALAVGMRDIAGTGNFSTEYIVATKKIGNLDITSGIGLGLLGSDNSIRNPFLNLNEGFR